MRPLSLRTRILGVSLKLHRRACSVVSNLLRINNFKKKINPPAAYILICMSLFQDSPPIFSHPHLWRLTHIGINGRVLLLLISLAFTLQNNVPISDSLFTNLYAPATFARYLCALFVHLFRSVQVRYIDGRCAALLISVE